MATVKVCDVCGQKAEESRFLVTGRIVDAAGSMSNDGVSVDLCRKHALATLLDVLQGYVKQGKIDMHEFNTRWFERIKNFRM